MGKFAAGQVAVLPFPFSDLSRNKYRPALLLADVGRGDWIACQITSNPYGDSKAVEIGPADFSAGSLMRTSFARPGKLFTANEGLFASVAATVRVEKLTETRSAVISLLISAP
ncbi:MAG: MazF family transcriptional regulator [Thioalkalivibrio sp.]|nr:MAG: MazF family transcriptional regulator [Thioalkalivibrio sp.]